jgi:predicted CoA-binding protein
MDTQIQDFIGGKRLALAGASRNPGKFGNAAYKELQGRGYQVFLIHPEAREIDGATCYPNLAAVPEPVDGVLVSVPPSQSEKLLREAAAKGVRNVWLQAGAESPELLALGKELGLNVVSGKCILMYAPPVRSFHWWHRAFCRVTGQL